MSPGSQTPSGPPSLPGLRSSAAASSPASAHAAAPGSRVAAVTAPPMAMNFLRSSSMRPSSRTSPRSARGCPDTTRRARSFDRSRR
ncbi:hypothetical protein D7147_27365 [Micromonospora musae]|uniref:Uncharacterized protein n=1 Tax=Micromonospora musae TaxID=1894970 RepID=A0ABX9QWR9_9ACTN|nr:hypothetical protein D7147_27365 [Micromonospora musae]